jgi:hypothetical protein
VFRFLDCKSKKFAKNEQATAKKPAFSDSFLTKTAFHGA